MFELLNTSEKIGAALRRELARLELSATGFSILALVHRRPTTPLGNRELADKLNITPQTVSETLARLELTHLITRVRRPDHRRKIAIALTAQGQKTIIDALHSFERTIHRLMSALSPPELTSLRELCARLNPDRSLS